MMKPQMIGRAKSRWVATLFCWCVVLLCDPSRLATAQIFGGMSLPNSSNGMPPGPGMPPGAMPSPSKSDSSGKEAGGPWLPTEPPPTSITTNLNGSKTTNAPEEIQLSFQGANVDMVVQWLAQTTGKTVIKHPQVQCQLTITSSKKVSKREAIVLVYRALAVEGFTAIESEQSILIVPAGQEPRISPEVVANPNGELPEGRTRLVKVFSLRHVQAAEIKDRIQGALTDKGTIDINERNNQVILTDYTDNIRLAGELIAALDTDKPEDVTVRVIPLKSVGALALAKEVTPLYQKTDKSLDLAADDRANALIVLSSRAAFDSIYRLVSSLDTEDAQEKAMETFVLKNADAEDVAKQLQDLSQNQTTSSRYVYFFTPQSDSAQKKFNVVADRRRNAVIVQAVPAQLPDIKKIIEQLDAPVGDDSLAPKIFALKYISAVDLEDVLNELFLKKQPQRSYFDLFNGNSEPNVDRDVGRLYGKVRITSDPYSNSLIVTSNSKENLAVIGDMIKQLDRPSEAGESTMRIGLKYAKASTVANSLNILFAKNGSPPLRPVAIQNPNAANQAQQQAQPQAGAAATGFDLEQETKEEGYFPWIGGQPDLPRTSDGRAATAPVSDLVGRVRAVSDQRGNAVLVSANVHFFPQILQLIQEVDAPSDKVTIEARIIQVSSDFLDKLGVRWSPNGSQVFSADDYDNSLLASSSGNFQKGFGGTTTVNTPASSVNSVVQTLASLRSGMVSSTLNIDYLVQFLRKNTDATVLGEPCITIDDNEMGKLFVGQEVPVPDTTQISSVGSQNTTIKYKDVGVILEVTPHINSDGDVQLKIHAESSTVDSSATVLGGDVFDTDNYRTEVTTKNNQSLLLGGIIQKQTSQVIRKVPLLGSIPGIGWVFKKKDKSTQEVELMVFLRPTVIHSAQDARELQQELERKTPLLQKWEEDSRPNPDK